MTFLAIQIGGSVLAILLLALLASRLGLGGDVRLRDTDQVRALASAALCGFDPVETVLDRAGIGALLRDGSGRVMLLRRHGAHFVARLLDSHAFARLDRNFLTIGTGEKVFGSVTLDLGEQAQIWAASLRRLGD
ncbi:MAG: hypothetical protein ABL926_10710 [Novosphingobium sp.]|uniref:hypothetical protein n=1 Tax=Novosphingobium sp. TaxID=1874826 RepID=UPI0032B77208